MSTEQQPPACGEDFPHNPWDWTKALNALRDEPVKPKTAPAPASGSDLETWLHAPAPPPRTESLPNDDPAIVFLGASSAAPELSNPVDAKREELRKYFEKEGGVEGIFVSLRETLVAMYEEPEKLKIELKAAKSELKMAETEIGQLKQKVETLQAENILPKEESVAGAVGDPQSKSAQSSELWKNRDLYPMIDRGGYIMHPRNSSEVLDLSDPVMVHVNTAEAILRRGIREHKDLPVIKDIVEFNYIENNTLESQFMAKKLELLKEGRDFSEVVMFHGTSPANTHDICTGNFNLDLSNRFAFGRGIYFSKCPNTSLQYGKDLILCRVLPGLKHMTKWVEKDRQTLQDGYDSLEIDWQRNNDPGSNAIVVRAADQILPYCVIRTEHVTATKPKNPAPKKATNFTNFQNTAAIWAPPPQPKSKAASPPPKATATATVAARPPPSKPKSKPKKKNDCVIS